MANQCSNSIRRSIDINNVVSSISSSDTPGSPQNLAKSWLLNNDTATNACHGTNQILQRFSLAVFFYSTLGSNWFNNNFWLGQKGECEWHGVICTNGTVTSLELGTFDYIFPLFLCLSGQISK